MSTLSRKWDIYYIREFILHKRSPWHMPRALNPLGQQITYLHGMYEK